MNHTEQGTVAVGAPGSAMRRIMSAPEPLVEHITRYDVSTSTPWGTAQTAKSLAHGIVWYTTASHGGCHVSPKLLETMPEYLRGDACAPHGWFEEDCAWAMVAIAFPQHFTIKDRATAIDTMRQYYPEQWAKFCQPA